MPEATRWYVSVGVWRLSLNHISHIEVFQGDSGAAVFMVGHQDPVRLNHGEYKKLVSELQVKDSDQPDM